MKTSVDLRARARAGLWALCVSAVVCGACSRSEPEGEHTEAAAHDEHDPHAAEAAAGDSLLRIDPEMLRDLRITTAPAEARSSGEGVSALGELTVDETAYAEVGPPIPARVSRVFVEPGAEVRTGEPLVALESAELGQARAAYGAAIAHAELARQALARKEDLASEQIAPQREVEEARAAAAAAAADLRAARAALVALGMSEQDIESQDGGDARFVLRAPIAGTVIERTALRGQMSDPARPLFRIGDLSRLWLTVHAFERDAVRVQVGAPARISFPALPGRTFTGNVAMVGRQVDVGSRTVPVRVVLANDNGILRPGMSATAWLPLGASGAAVVAVPAASLQRMADGWIVFLPHAPGEFEIRRIGRGRDLSGEVEIVHGLAAGETVVVEGAFLLKAEADKSRGEGGHHDH